MEVWPENHRATLAGLIGAANNVGFALVGIAGLTFSVTTATWRWVALIGTLPGALAFAIQRFVPESEKWKAAAANGDLQPLREIARSSALRLTLIASVLSGIALIGSWGCVQWVPLWADQLVGGLLPHAKAYTQLDTALGAMAGGFLGAYLGGKLGRRPAYAVMCVASLVTCGVLFRGMSSYNLLFLGLTFLMGLTTTTFYGWLPLYLPELFPTRIRATAQGIAFNVGRFLAAAGALGMGSLMQAMHGSYARAGATISLIYVVGLAAIWFAPETHGRALPA
jgi:MFS family permease